jgi:hypothetical protein
VFGDRGDEVLRDALAAMMRGRDTSDAAIRPARSRCRCGAAPLGTVTFVRNRFQLGGIKEQAPLPSIVIEWTKDNIKAGRERLAAGDTNLVAMLDPLPAFHGDYVGKLILDQGLTAKP